MRIVCGLDVHKDSIFLCILSSTGEIFENFIKQLPGHKSDVKDAQWIAECMMKELVRGSFVPPERIQQLRLYDRRIYDLDNEIIRKLAKLGAAVQRCNIRLSKLCVKHGFRKLQENDRQDMRGRDIPRGNG